jgi:hypothetical protein
LSVRGKMNYITRIVLACPVVIGISFAAGWAVNSTMQKYVSGKSYTRGNYLGQRLYVSFMKPGYTLEKHPPMAEAVAPPYETHVRPYVLKDGKIVKEITSLNDFEGLVVIDTAEKAVEFVRLMTSEQTYYLFRPAIRIEVFKKNSNTVIYGGCSPGFFTRNNFKELEIEPRGDYFEIRRTILLYLWPGARDYPQSPVVYRTTEKVFSNGAYILTAEKVQETIAYDDIPYPLEPK